MISSVPSSRPVTIAGRTVRDPEWVVVEYLREHSGTVAHFDALAGASPEVTWEMVKVTRSPWMNSRISNLQAEWFIECSKSAPWSSVAGDAQLVDAPAAEPGGLYDDALTLFEHFAASAPKGVAMGKISKVLYLMRPGLYPILDRRLQRLYWSLSRDAARTVAEVRPEMGRYRQLFWEAVRLDLVSSSDAIGDVRAALAAGLLSEVEHPTRLSDVRLLDILSWTI